MSEEKPGITLEQLREDFVKRYIAPYARSESVLNAFKAVDRGDFAPSGNFAYENNVIPLGKGSSLSEPSLTAAMINLLNLTGEENVLDVGTGSGYTAAVLSKCAKEVHTIDYDEKLSETAAQRLEKLGFDAVKVHTGDGAMGVLDHAPYDAILVTVGVVEIPQALFDQLKERGRIVAPSTIEESSEGLYIVSGIKLGNTLRMSVFYPVAFHKLMSDEHGGWSPQVIAKERSYEIIFDDKNPKRLEYQVMPEELNLIEEGEEEDVEPTNEVLEILVKSGITPEEFLVRMEQLGMKRREARLLLSLHPEPFNDLLQMLEVSSNLPATTEETST